MRKQGKSVFHKAALPIHIDKYIEHLKQDTQSLI